MLNAERKNTIPHPICLLLHLTTPFIGDALGLLHTPSKNISFEEFSSTLIKK